MIPLYGHINQETAYLVDDYPYGNQRCCIRFWIEEHPKRGFRFVSQTKNPRTHRWNNPRQGAYALMGANLYLDDNGHVQCQLLTEYSSPQEVYRFLTNFPDTRIHSNLKVFVIGRRKVSEHTMRGESVFAINGVPQIPSETDKQRAAEEYPIWQLCLNFINAGS